MLCVNQLGSSSLNFFLADQSLSLNEDARPELAECRIQVQVI